MVVDWVGGVSPWFGWYDGKFWSLASGYAGSGILRGGVVELKRFSLAGYVPARWMKQSSSTHECDVFVIWDIDIIRSKCFLVKSIHM